MENLETHPEAMKTNLEQRKTMKTNLELSKKHINPPVTMENKPGTMKYHENRPGTTKN